LDCCVNILRELNRVPKVGMVTVTLNMATIEHDEIDTSMFLAAIRAAGKYEGRVSASRRVCF
jgi:hypothetical protein